MGATLENNFSSVLANDLSFRILRALKPVGLTQAELVGCLGAGLTSQNIGLSLARLERARLVTRIVIGANDHWWLCREGPANGYKPVQ